MLLYRVFQVFKWKLKILLLKIVYGNKIKIAWTSRIAPSVKIRINGTGFISIGDRVELRENCILNVSEGGKMYLGDRVFINDGCFLNSRKLVEIGADTMLGQSVKIYDHDHDYRSSNIKTNFKQEPVKIGEKVWLCTNVIVLKGCFVGAGSVVAAGTVLRKNIEPNTLCYTVRMTQEKLIEYKGI